MQVVPAQMDIEEALPGVDKMSSTLTEEEKKRKDRKALTQLHLYLSNKILQVVMKEKTAARLWKRLEQIFMSKTLTSKLHIKQRLYAHRLEEGTSVHEHLTVFKEILSNLKAMEKKKHIKDECYKLQNKIKREATNQKGKQPENSGEADVVEDYSDGELLVASVNNSKVSNKWILDLGCTFHMSPNWDWFKTYEIVSEGVVLMGNNASCKITGVGTIKVKMFDGVVRTLSDVCHFLLSNDDITKLWHVPPWHMSENDMAELSKRGLLNGVPSRGGANYMLTFIDDFSRKVWAFFLKQKNDVFFQNGVAERMNRTIMEKVQCMLSNANLPKSFCAGAASTIFGCPTYAHVDNEKLEPKSIKCVFLGYKAGVKGYKLWCPKNRNVVISRDVVFDETAMLPNLSIKDSSNKENQKQVEHQFNTKPTKESTPQANTKNENRVASSPQYSTTKNRTKREIKPPNKYVKADLVAYTLNVAKDIDVNQEPSNYSEAVSYKDSEKWIFTMQKEMKSLHKNRTWDFVKLPKGKKVVHCKWVFKKKKGTPGVEEPRYKARLVAKGYSQISGVDFTDVFSPVVKHSLIRALLDIVSMHDLELEKLDVKTIFLHKELEEDIYMQQPEGFTVSKKEDYVCLLKKSPYGLKQSPR
ncbi:hypothetical protein CXB51_008232 [Gossypium anomalum]|uniref:Reverse transcriptase Ty1/copia-type domain-containing protein n=1 Tax=Gossypium anomalum TaxID=47600 RepID=A0A8J5ZAF5_9ROSI|nr:hypothetical protein CXB51_008232 [Gossypium anomalum]